MITYIGRDKMLSHVSDKGVNMVDISKKGMSVRTAVARGSIYLRASTLELVASDGIKKGNVMATAQLAGIMAAKRTSELIPLCHQVPLESVNVDLEVHEGRIEATCTVKTTFGTGVEMEALQGVTEALLTIWDMTKAVEKDEGGQYPHTRIDNIHVERKEKLECR